VAGSSVPYQLRINKHVDRILFSEALGFLDQRWPRDAGHLYVSMGGLTLQDHRVIHGRFPHSHLMSIEEDETTHSRQLFNCPYGFITCKHMTSAQLIADFEAILEAVECRAATVWLDYAAANQRLLQLRETETLVGKLAVGDIIRVTMNANPSTLVPARDDKADVVVQRERLEVLSGQIDDYITTPPSAGAMTSAGLARVLVGAIRTAMLRGMDANLGLTLHPLLLLRYNDLMHQMVTVTAALVPKTFTRMRVYRRLKTWPYFANTWGGLRELSLPDLTARERMCIDQHFLQRIDVGDLLNALPFPIGRNKRNSLALLSAYVDHYRVYPDFMRVLVT